MGFSAVAVTNKGRKPLFLRASLSDRWQLKPLAIETGGN